MIPLSSSILADHSLSGKTSVCRHMWDRYNATLLRPLERPAHNCVPDLHEYLGGANIMPTTPHPITNEKVPLTLGHEFSGTIEEIGDGVSDIKVGARVTVQPIIYDGTCGACKAGYINCCDSNGFVGLSGRYLCY